MSVSTAAGREPSSLAVEEHRGPSSFASLRGPWEELLERSDGPPFLSWEWLETWWSHLAPGRTPVFLSAWEGQRLVGLLALGEERVAPFGIGRLSFLGERWAGADYLDVLAERGREDEVAELLFTHLSRMPFDVLDLDGFEAGSGSLAVLQRLWGDRLERETRHVCPGIELNGTWQQILKRSRRGDNYRRRLRQLSELPGFEFRVVGDPAQVGAAFDRFLDLHERRWAAQGGSDALGRPILQAFHRSVVERLARVGWLRFEELWVEGGCRASIYSIHRGSTHFFYQSGYDPDWAGKSVGLVVLGLSIEDAISRGASVYDFLRGTETYKFDWATRSLETVRVRVIRGGASTSLFLLGEKLEKVVRAGAHSLLPTAGVEALRRLRRWRERTAGRGGGR